MTTTTKLIMWAFISCCRHAEPIPNQELSLASNLDGFVGWTKTLVSHFLAKRALEQHCLKLLAKEKVNIHIIAADRSPLRYPTWPVMKKVIREVVESSKATGNGGVALDPAEEVVKKLEQRILSEKNQHKFIRVFRQILSSNDPMQVLTSNFPTGLHCEFILAAFLLYPLQANPTNDEVLLKIAKVLLFSQCFQVHPLDNHHRQAFTNQWAGFSIAVSKLLCPACWEGLLFLDPVKQFDVCGHHFVPYAIELPSWLPQVVFDAMCKKFRALVAEELQVLLESPDGSLQSSGVPRQSQESQSNISVASSHTTDHVGVDHLVDSYAGVWSYIQVSLFL